MNGCLSESSAHWTKATVVHNVMKYHENDADKALSSSRTCINRLLTEPSSNIQQWIQEPAANATETVSSVAQLILSGPFSTGVRASLGKNAKPKS
ncbi:hypothetical protein VTP01DRAFT_7940 [Rhizomucor pusillus]|uniref:uncharacterized protein n=1 Tax=Rhizomucor pusillus TaxID=4840 RepID=UPI003742375D